LICTAQLRVKTSNAQCLCKIDTRRRASEKSFQVKLNAPSAAASPVSALDKISREILRKRHLKPSTEKRVLHALSARTTETRYLFTLYRPRQLEVCSMNVVTLTDNRWRLRVRDAIVGLKEQESDTEYCSNLTAWLSPAHHGVQRHRRIRRILDSLQARFQKSFASGPCLLWKGDQFYQSFCQIQIPCCCRSIRYTENGKGPSPQRSAVAVVGLAIRVIVMRLVIGIR